MGTSERRRHIKRFPYRSSKIKPLGIFQESKRGGNTLSFVGLVVVATFFLGGCFAPDSGQGSPNQDLSPPTTANLYQGPLYFSEEGIVTGRRDLDPGILRQFSTIPQRTNS